MESIHEEVMDNSHVLVEPTVVESTEEPTVVNLSSRPFMKPTVVESDADVQSVTAQSVARSVVIQCNQASCNSECNQ